MSTIRILSLDPGLTTLGWAISTYDIDKNHLTVHRFGNYKSVKVAIKDKKQSDRYGVRIIALDLLESTVKSLIASHKPDYIASEDIFLHIRHINAFAALVLCLHAIKHAAYSKDMTVFTIAPRLVKKLAADTGDADKVAIQKSILTNPNITVIENKQSPIAKMCEHEADAIAVGHAFTIYHLPSLLTPQVTIESTPIIKRRRRVIKRDTSIVLPIKQ